MCTELSESLNPARWIRGLRTKTGLLLLLSGMAGMALADSALLIGGGSNPSNSSAKDERTLHWAQKVLQERSLPVTTLFSDGNADTPDIQIAVSEDDNHLQALSTVFGDPERAHVQFRNHTLSDVAGSSDRPTLQATLQAWLSDGDTEPGFVMFAGHGLPATERADQVSMALWNNTSMSVSEFHSLLGKRQQPLRYLFTQCYSGGFHRIAYLQPETGLELAPTLRCGFTSESAWQTEHRCRHTTEDADRQDYTDFFFGALHGYERTGDILGHDPDLDQDRTVSLREAHLFALQHGTGDELFRSTSEDYLLNWEPWFLRWLPGPHKLPNNDYARLYRDLASEHNIPLDLQAANAIREQIQLAQADSDALDRQQTDARIALDQARNTLKQGAINRWPALLMPFSSNYETLAASGGLAEADAWLENQAEYKVVTARLEDISSLRTQQRRINEQRSLFRKLLHLRRVSSLQQKLMEYGTPDDIGSYEALLRCEDTAMPWAGSTRSPASLANAE